MGEKIDYITTGVTRRVLLIGKYAIKFPSFYSYRHFLQGLLANNQEAHWSKAFKWTKKLCPVLWSSWGWFIIIMPRVDVLTEEEARIDISVDRYPHALSDIFNFDKFILIEEGELGTFPCEKKTDSFGWLNDRLVIIDYGS